MKKLTTTPDQMELDELRLALRCAHEAGLSDESLIKYQLTNYMLRQIRYGAVVRDYALNYARLSCALNDKCRQLSNSSRIAEAEHLHAVLHDLNMRFMRHIRSVKI